jgi:predicted signal transduction protein with EAL and GGDEF domain
VATRLAGAVRRQDTIARMGGDEFVVLLPDVADEPGAAAVAEKLIGSLREPFDLDGRHLYISCSIGIASWPSHGSDYEHLLLHADAAMYEAKARGRNTYAFHSVATSRRRELLDLEARLHTAIDRNELVVLYQPQVDLDAMRLMSVEALVRWDHPKLGRLGPDRFLHLAEESGVITRIDGWVRARAAADARRWFDDGLRVPVAVNLSTADLRRLDLVDDIRDLVAASGLPAELFELEVTDRVALGESDLRPTLEALAAVGVRLAVDDFGVGTSVLGRLQHGPFHTLKIDRSLVSQIDTDGRQATIVQALVVMAHELGFTVIAEGVETVAQAEVLRRFGCERAQGWLFSAAVDAITIPALAAEIASTAHLP